MRARVVEAVAQGARDGTLPPSIGLRVKPLTEELRARSVRTLDLLVTGLVERGGLPRGWIVTLPKVTVVEQVDVLRRRAARARALARPRRRRAALRDPGRGAAGDPRRTRDARCCRALLDAADGRLVGRRLRHVRLHRGLQHHRGAPAHAPPRVRVREARHAGRVRRHRRVALRRLDRRCSPCRRDDGDSSRRARAAGDATSTTCATRSRAASTRAGTCTPRSSCRATPRSTSFFLEGIDAAGARLRELRRQGRAGDARRRRVRRAGDRSGTARLLPPRRSTPARSPRPRRSALTGLTADEFRGRSFVRDPRATGGRMSRDAARSCSISSRAGST